MNILMIYGGRGLAKDPTLAILEKIKEVLTELEVNVTSINLYQEVESDAIPSTLHTYDGMILATTVDWFGIGHYLQKFLDDCWHYGDKAIISEIYMMPIICSTNYGERDAQIYIQKAWDLLNGIQTEGIYATFSDGLAVESNDIYLEIIEKKAENLYRTIKQNKNKRTLPKSLTTLLEEKETQTTKTVNDQRTKETTLLPEENQYIKKQQKDIEELKSFFKQKLETKNVDEEIALKQIFEEKFVNIVKFKGVYKIHITDKNKTLLLDIMDDKIKCTYEDKENVNVEIQCKHSELEKITEGYMTFQRAFLTGSINAKGDFKLLYMLDQLFDFGR
ncbi:SCP-2 sterol transfer family protein [Natranaerovirga hydrolytica]|uniref:SCP-2 sterol transfer family protein n=1 Tax=Natranaerovirga hydrolytica TaxID=680378 RepID=A0A4R1MJY9_9FIRM|nr:SCP2 sterol-binding domain-containing protein [Natranaerovirga hydrolytica]TCK93118.1 SCP-2 sterol transfer family protein [Natranaerovirga hydrolytica]